MDRLNSGRTTIDHPRKKEGTRHCRCGLGLEIVRLSVIIRNLARSTSRDSPGSVLFAIRN